MRTPGSGHISRYEQWRRPNSSSLGFPKSSPFVAIRLLCGEAKLIGRVLVNFVFQYKGCPTSNSEVLDKMSSSSDSQNPQNSQNSQNSQKEETKSTIPQKNVAIIRPRQVYVKKVGVAVLF